jgi:hypothetical protein
MSIPGCAGKLRALFSASLAAVALSLWCSCALVAQSHGVYVDSQQRFTIQVPPGWVAKPFNSGGVSGVTISHGEISYVQIFLQTGIDPASFLKALNSGIETSHPGYKISDRGQRTVSGESRMYIVGESAETPTAPRTRVYLETFAANGLSYAIIAATSGKAAAAKEMTADINVSQQMIQSLNVKGEPAPPSRPATPVPAKTPAPPPTPPPLPAPSPATPPLPARAAADPSAMERAAAPDLPPDDQKRLAALDSAVKSGVLSNDEYQAKKSALYASAHQQAETAARRKALDQALADGVLTQDEYDRKKQELTGEAPSAPAATSSTVAGSTTTRPANPEVELPSLAPTETIAARAEPQPEPLPKSWIADIDPAGFVLNLPAVWTVNKVRATGQIVVRGTRGEQVMIWPLRLTKPELDARDAASLIQELARRFDALMPWGAVQTTHNAARVTGLGSQRSATAILSWSNNPGGASIYFYGLEAPGDIYADSENSFAGVVRSFQIVPDALFKDSPGTAAGGGGQGTNFVKWSDPHEGAFTVSVPQGWKAIGGTYRLSTEDVRYGVVMESPDGQLRASIGDAVVGAFTQPTQGLSATGLREGAYQTLPDGTRIELLRYLSGQQFARSYVETLVSRQCSNPQIVSNNTREDMAANFGQAAANQGFIDALLTAGDVSFACTLDGRPVKGKYIAATIRMAPNISPMWFVYRLYGYMAFAGREQEGENVLMQLIQSWKFTPEWEKLQKETGIPAAQPDSTQAQEARERAQAAIVDDQRQISEMIARDTEQRRRLYDQRERNLRAAVLGTLDIVDPDTRAQYKLNDFNDFHYLSNDGLVYNASSPDAAGTSVREMIALP